MNYVITFGIEFVIMVISVLLFKIVKVKFEDVGFAEFSINKRLVGFMAPLMMMGMGVSLPKFLPNEDDKGQLEIHYSALMIVTSLFVISLLLFTLLSGLFSKLVFGDYQHRTLFGAALLYVYSLMCHACLYNFFRGKFKFGISSLIQLVNLGLLPLLTYFVATSMLNYFLILSISTLVFLSLINFFFIPIRFFPIQRYVLTIKRMVSYGVQRMPGDVLLGLFLAIPTFIASNYFTLSVGGTIAFSLSLFNIVIALMSPVNIILLPKASKMVHEKNYVLLRSISYQLLFASIGIGVAVMLVVAFFGQFILQLFNVNNIAEASVLLKIIFAGIIGFSVFSVIRSIIDAYYDRARVTSIIVVAFLFFLLSLGILTALHLFTIQNVLVVFVISINMLGLLTFLSLMSILKSIRT